MAFDKKRIENNRKHIAGQNMTVSGRFCILFLLQCRPRPRSNLHLYLHLHLHLLFLFLFELDAKKESGEALHQCNAIFDKSNVKRY
jgi:hypothetical protein